jgi:hypothetical protein
MEKCAQLEASERNGNLHIRIKGVYAENTPSQLVDCMQQNYRGVGNIFIHTDKVTGIIATGAVDLSDKGILGRTRLNKKHIYLIGSKAMELDFPCNKIIIPPPRKARCTGCRNCTCTSKSETNTTLLRSN